jgi:hypothetical protein
MTCAHVWLIVVRRVVDIVFLHICGIDNPRRIRYDLIHPATMADRLAAFCVSHNTPEFMLFYLLVAVHTDNKVHVRERQLSLAKVQ